MPLFNWLKTSLSGDQNSYILWIPVFFSCGIILYFSFPNNSYLLPIFLFSFSIFLIYYFKYQAFNIAIIASAIFLSGFLWAKFYTERIVFTTTIKQQFYATALGTIEEINIRHNSVLKRDSSRITLKNVNLFKAGTREGDILEKKVKKISGKKIQEKKNLAKKPRKSKPKTSKTITKNYLNVAGYQEINREFLSTSYKSQEKNWLGNKYLNPPKKISLGVNTKLNGAKIGDLVQIRVFLKPYDQPYFKNGYDAAFNNYFKGIGGSGFAASDLIILESTQENSLLKFVVNDFSMSIEVLRQNISRRIIDQMDRKEGGIAVALLVGNRQMINPEILQTIRNSGLAHLIAISGLHFTLAAGIFFFSIRFLLSLNQYFTLHFGIKKIAALLAILASFFYLLIAGMPIPAIRAFIIISLVFTAILIDLKPNSFRSLAFAALAILILSPNVIFSVSFQLSFAAILGLICLADSTKKLHINSSFRPFYLKFGFYFLGIILSSAVATIFTTPFSIYYFNNFISFGIFANLAAIPIVTFLTMPLGFLSLALMPFNLEKIALFPMQISIDWIISIANFTTSIKHSYLPVKNISSHSFGLIIFGGLWFCLWKKSWRFLGFAPLIIGIYLAYQTPIPTFLIDEEKKLFAFYYNQKLIFPKPSKSRQARDWAKKIGLTKVSNLKDLSEEEKRDLKLNCVEEFCEFELEGKRILVLLGRNKINQFCQLKFDLLVNLKPKYQIPICQTELPNP
ncbi:MAG: ComEC/Rec2-related protein [Rickettsiales bacterium]|jgi:ComEC/Rec2-related protein